MRELRETPNRLVERDGSINFGTFRLPFREMNILDSPLYNTGGRIPASWKRFRLKEWQHFGLIHPEYYLGMVIFDAKFLNVSFAYCYDRKRNLKVEHSRQTPGGTAKIAGQLYDDQCEFSRKDYYLNFKNRLDRGFHQLRFEIQASKRAPEMRGEIKVFEDLNSIEPLVQVSPINPFRPFYTHKVAAPAEGWAEVGGTRIEFQPGRDLALMDEQKTFYPYRSFWKWATAGGHNAEGRLIAFNLCQNMISSDEEANENCLWVDGKITLLRAARFSFDERDVLKAWKVVTSEGRVALDFQPQGERSERINFGFVLSDFHQPFGLYRGKLIEKTGKEHRVSGLFGLAEHHRTRY
jgi:hypothetical protein